jgi:sialic acid synthase SpsE
MAKNCGADAVKFQMFTPKDLYGLNQDWIVEKNGVLNWGWLPKLRIEADAHGIELMCTAFSPEGVDYVDQFVKRHKIASAELSHLPLLERVRATNKPVLVSTGGSSLKDIRLALAALGGLDVTLLYCVSAYPASDVNLYGINMLRKEFWPEGRPDRGVSVGYSCHTADISTPVSAVHNHQAAVIEKHFKLRDMPTPDNDHALDPQRFKLMVRQIRSNPIDHVIFPSQQELDMGLKHNRRLICTSDISAGQALDYGKNYGVYRSLKEDRHGITGFAYQLVNQKVATKDLKPGDPIGPGDFR